MQKNTYLMSSIHTKTMKSSQISHNIKLLVNMRICNEKHSTRHTLLESNRDFKHFYELHDITNPSKLWKLPVTTSDIKIVDYIRRLWVTVPNKNVRTHLCPQCECSFLDLHIVSDCAVTWVHSSRHIHGFHKEQITGVVKC